MRVWEAGADGGKGSLHADLPAGTREVNLEYQATQTPLSAHKYFNYKHKLILVAVVDA